MFTLKKDILYIYIYNIYIHNLLTLKKDIVSNADLGLFATNDRVAQ